MNSKNDLMTPPNGDFDPILLTIPQAARALAIGRTTLYELIGAQRIEAVHIGRCVRIPVEALHAFVEAERASR